MGKGRIFGSVAVFASIVAAVVWSGCGSSNDQGISFRSLGYFADSDGTIGESGTCASLTNDTQVPSINADGTQNGGFLGLQNSMFQGINLNFVNLSYQVSGSSLNIPDDVFALGGRLGPADNSQSSGPTGFFQVVIVSPAIMQFLNQNRSRLPQPPFSMVVFTTATGTADNGDVFTTNTVNFQVNFVDTTCAPPTPVPQAGSEGGTTTE
ncbi:MAG TPA: hypothetical protein VLF14_03615 [Candidatus Binatia bacterium]|nr:hypothetical protein [Candidatus Binatia bacterium]